MYVRMFSIVFTALSLSTASAEWIRFRGPNGNGISTATNMPSEWSAKRNMRWSVKLPGVGHSSPIAYKNRIYVTCYSGYGLDRHAPGNKDDLKRHLVCLNADTGQIIWQKAMKANGHEHAFTSHLKNHGYATNTPTVDDTGVYVFYGASGAAKYDHKGELIWQRSCGTGSNGSGSTASPLLHGDLVIVPSISESFAFHALDKSTGEIKWKAKHYIGFPSPIIINARGRDQLLVVPGIAYDPTNGSELWKIKVPSYCASPAYGDGIICIGKSEEMTGFRAGGPGITAANQVLWTAKPGTSSGTPVYYKGHFYWAVDNGGIAVCVDAKTGEIKYKQRLEPRVHRHYASPIVADGKLYYVSQFRGAHVLAASPDFKVIAYNTIEGDEGPWIASPSVSKNRLLLRSRTTLYCIEASN